MSETMLEKMEDFFDSRLDMYDEHQLNCIDSARDFLQFTAECLPPRPGCAVLDLGCGTGLELERYFAINPSAQVTGIDMAPGMLRRLKEKFPDKKIALMLGSYFDLPFGCEAYEAVVSVESLHHFTAAEKLPLYKKLWNALKPGGGFHPHRLFCPVRCGGTPMQGGLAPPEGRAGAHGRRLLPLRHPAHGGTRDRLPEGRRLLPGGAAAALGPDPHPSCGQVTLPCPHFGRSGGAPLTGPAAPADKEKSEPITGRRRVRIF